METLKTEFFIDPPAGMLQVYTDEKWLVKVVMYGDFQIDARFNEKHVDKKYGEIISQGGFSVEINEGKAYIHTTGCPSQWFGRSKAYSKASDEDEAEIQESIRSEVERWYLSQSQCDLNDLKISLLRRRNEVIEKDIKEQQGIISKANRYIKIQNKMLNDNKIELDKMTE